MKRSIFLAATLVAAVTPCSALVVVDGVAGGDGDGTSPFETTQAAVKHAIATNDPVVEVRTNAPTGGVAIVPAVDYLQGPLTIRAGAGFTPVFTSRFVLNPATPQHLITLENITIELPPVSLDAAILGAGRLTLTGCNVKAEHQSVGNYPLGIRCNLRSPRSDGVLTITNSYVAGLNGIMAGHSIRDYNITSSTVIGVTGPGLPWANSSPVANIMNWETNAAGSLVGLIDSNTTIAVATDTAGTTAELTLAAISEPRTLTLNQSIFRSDGPQLAWPPNSLDYAGTPWYGPQNDNTLGPINATNCVFDGCNPVTIGSRHLTANQSEDSTFTNCTFRTSYGVTGSVMLQSQGAVVHTFRNNLFDSPAGIYGIGVFQSTEANVSVTGNGNVYSVLSGAEYALLGDAVAPTVTGSRPAFETVYTYAGRTPDSSYVSTPHGYIPLPYGENLVGGKAVPLVPPVLVDMHGNARPQPLLSTGDVGAVEFDESVEIMEAVAYDTSAPTATNAFTSPEEAVTYAVNNGLDTVEIIVNNPTGGFAIRPATHYLQKPLTIKPGVGINPIFNMALTINPANPNTTVTLQNVHVQLADDSNGAAVYAAGIVVMNNCNILADDVGGGHYPVGIACNLRSPSSVGTLILDGCMVTGHNAIVAGHSIKNYNITQSTVVGLTSDLGWNLTGTVVHLMNWETGPGGNLTNLIDHTITIPVKNSTGGTDNVQLASISEPRELNINRSIFRSNGQLLAWPPDTLESNGNFYYGTVNDNTVGPVRATNTVFDGCNPVLIGNPYLWDTQSHDSTFTHCTFRTTFGVTGAVRLHSIDPATYTFNNCLFDSPDGIYGIGVDEASNGQSVLDGEGNVYVIQPGVEVVTLLTASPATAGPALPPFESTYTYAAPVEPAEFLTDPNGVMLLNYGKGLAGGKAVALVPAVTVDLFQAARPQPVGATRSDVGAVEFDETPPASVQDWTLY